MFYFSGKNTHATGESYYCYFDSDACHGELTFTFVDGATLVGQYHRGKPNGDVIFTQGVYVASLRWVTSKKATVLSDANETRKIAATVRFHLFLSNHVAPFTLVDYSF